jgi:hypothetical protein
MMVEIWAFKAIVMRAQTEIKESVNALILNYAASIEYELNFSNLWVTLFMVLCYGILRDYS